MESFQKKKSSSFIATHLIDRRQIFCHFICGPFSFLSSNFFNNENRYAPKKKKFIPQIIFRRPNSNINRHEMRVRYGLKIKKKKKFDLIHERIQNFILIDRDKEKSRILNIYATLIRRKLKRLTLVSVDFEFFFLFTFIYLLFFTIQFILIFINYNLF